MNYRDYGRKREAEESFRARISLKVRTVEALRRKAEVLSIARAKKVIWTRLVREILENYAESA